MTLAVLATLAAIAAAVVLWPRPARAGDGLDSEPDFYAAAGYFANGNYDDAIGQLLGLLKRYPRNARLQLILADAYERTGDLPTARRLYQAALDNKPAVRESAVAREGLDRVGREIARRQSPAAPGELFALSADQVAAMSVVYEEPAVRRTPHFEIRTFNGELADLLAERVEAVFDRVRRTTLGGQLFPHKIELIVYPTQQAYLKAEPAPHWSGGGYVFQLRPDGTARRAVTLVQVDEQNRFRETLLSRDLPHELAHVVLREYFGQTGCPTWLDEGLSCLAEQDGGRALAGRMAELVNRQQAIPLAELIDQINPALDQPVRFYIHAASLTRFLRSNLSDDQMKTFLGHVKDGQKPSVALGRTLFLDNRPGWLGELEQRWHRWVLEN